MNKRGTGTFYEEAVCNYLKNAGIEILVRNYRCSMGEIDIIGTQGDVLIFFEVKYRKNDSFGDALEAVDLKKQKKIINCANYYLAFKQNDKYIRFDVIGITGDNIKWIKDAFCV